MREDSSIHKCVNMYFRISIHLCFISTLFFNKRIKTSILDDKASQGGALWTSLVFSLWPLRQVLLLNRYQVPLSALLLVCSLPISLFAFPPFLHILVSISLLCIGVSFPVLYHTHYTLSRCLQVSSSGQKLFPRARKKSPVAELEGAR